MHRWAEPAPCWQHHAGPGGEAARAASCSASTLPSTRGILPEAQKSSRQLKRLGLFPNLPLVFSQNNSRCKSSPCPKVPVTAQTLPPSPSSQAGRLASLAILKKLTAPNSVLRGGTKNNLAAEAPLRSSVFFFTWASTAPKRCRMVQCIQASRGLGMTCTSHFRWLVYSFCFIPVNKFF